MDTTLRDGEQTSGVTFTENEKLSIAKMLLETLRVDRIEIASARVSKGEFSSSQKVLNWARNEGYLSQVEILGFVDGKKSLEWIHQAGGQMVNLLCKGSRKHVRIQLKKTPRQHLADIRQFIENAEKMGVKVNIYLEDWSNGMVNSPDYVFFLVEKLKNEKIERFMLPDTLGVLNPDSTFEFVSEMVDKFPKLHFDFHAHNDYDLAVANTLAAVKAGAVGVHTTVNGLGERAGNASLSSVVPVLNDYLEPDLSVDESKLNIVSKLVESFSGYRIPTNKPVVGENVFTQCCGVHADGDSKGNLYQTCLSPERFGRERIYALGKTSGKASVRKNLELVGIELDGEALLKVTERVVELGDQKELVTAEDLPYIVADVIGEKNGNKKVELVNYNIRHSYGLEPVASLSIKVGGKEYSATSAGDGQYDAFMKALGKIYKKLKRKLPELVDYVVTIPQGGRTDALVETTITWRNGKEFKTRGLDCDQVAAAIKATIKMLNLMESNKICLVT